MAQIQKESVAPATGVAAILRPAAIAAIALATALGTLGLAWLLAKPLALLFIAIVVAETLSPLVAFLSRWMPRVGAILLLYLVIAVILTALFLITVPPLVAQTQQAIKDLPALAQRLASLVNDFAPGVGSKLQSVLITNLPAITRTFAPQGFSVVTNLAVAVQLVFLSIYWLIAGPALSRFILSLFPERNRQSAASILDDISNTIGGYVRATVINAVLVSVIVYFGLLVLGVHYPLVLALITFVGEFIPFIGPTIAEVVAGAIALLMSPLLALITIGFYVILQQVAGNLFLPLLVRSQASISPLLVTLAIFIGTYAAGLVGAIIAIPLAGAVKIILVRVAAPAVREWVGAT